jgi:hypothetical protein
VSAGSKPLEHHVERVGDDIELVAEIGDRRAKAVCRDGAMNSVIMAKGRPSIAKTGFRRRKGTMVLANGNNGTTSRVGLAPCAVEMGFVRQLVAHCGHGC